MKREGVAEEKEGGADQGPGLGRATSTVAADLDLGTGQEAEMQRRRARAGAERLTEGDIGADLPIAHLPSSNWGSR